MNIHLKGYFGYENLGDDLLMICSYNLIKLRYPKANIYISSQSSYIQKLLPDIYLVSKLADLPSINILVYGGGGVFFDFKESTGYKLKNTLAKLLTLKIFNRLISFIKPKRQDIIIGWGLGIGPYHDESKLYLKEMYHLSRFKLLAVRDQQSLELVKKVNKHVYQFSDIVFEGTFWKHFFKIEDNAQMNNEVIFILRDWDFHDYEPSTKAIQVAEFLKEQKVTVKFLFFNPVNDQESIKKIKLSGFEYNTYAFEKVDTFLNQIKQASLIITLRAHGAIVGNVLGVPSFCIGVEPKLKNIHKMMPNSTLYFERDYIPDEIGKLALSELSKPRLNKKVKLDLESNIEKINDLKQLINTL